MRKQIFASLVAAAAFAWSPCATAQQPAKIVQVTEVVRADIAPTVSVPGTIYSRNDVQITAGIAGRLEMVAEPGTMVNAGDVVARIDRQALDLERAETVIARGGPECVTNACRGQGSSIVLWKPNQIRTLG